MKFWVQVIEAYLVTSETVDYVVRHESYTKLESMFEVT